MKKSIIIFIISLIIAVAIYLLTGNMISTVFFAISSISITYYFYTRNDSIKDITENNNKLISFVLTFILVAVALFYATFFIKGRIDLTKKKVKDYVAPVNLVAINTFDKSDAELSLQAYKSSMKDTSLVIVKDNSNVSFRNSTLEKYEGGSSNCEYSRLYGLNALFLNKAGSNTLLSTITMTSEEKCAIPLVVTGEKSVVTIEDSKIFTKSSKDTLGISTTYGGEVLANNITVLTKGKNSPALYVLEDSSIDIKNSLLETGAYKSPIMYTKGKVNLKNVTGTSNQDKILYLDNEGDVTIESSSFLTGGRGDNIKSSSAIDITGKNNLNILESTINISNKSLYFDVASIFCIHDADTNINLNNLTFNMNSNTFINAKDSKIKMEIKNSTITGDINLDNSNIELKLVATNYTGNIDNVSLELDKDSTLTLTKDTTLKSLKNEVEDNSNIEYNGFNLTIE